MSYLKIVFGAALFAIVISPTFHRFAEETVPAKIQEARQELKTWL